MLCVGVPNNSEVAVGWQLGSTTTRVVVVGGGAFNALLISVIRRRLLGSGRAVKWVYQWR